MKNRPMKIPLRMVSVWFGIPPGGTIMVGRGDTEAIMIVPSVVEN
jgi:hypothetical protein